MASRKANPEVIRQFDILSRKLEDAKHEYEVTALPNTFVEASLRHAQLVIRSIQQGFDFIQY